MLEAPPVFALEIRDADTSSPHRARHWLAWVLEAARITQDTIDAALLACSELVTNAVVHAGGRVLVSAQPVADGVRLCVHDDAAGAPWQEPGGDIDEHGRGLILVRGLAEQLDIDTHTHGTTIRGLDPRGAAVTATSRRALARHHGGRSPGRDNEPQTLAVKRAAPRGGTRRIANLEPIDLDETDAERRWQQWRRWNAEQTNEHPHHRGRDRAHLPDLRAVVRVPLGRGHRRGAGLVLGRGRQRPRRRRGHGHLGQRAARVYAWPNGTGEDTEPVITEARAVMITLFRAAVPLDEGITNFTTLGQAEATAHAILAMVARLRGDE